MNCPYCLSPATRQDVSYDELVVTWNNSSDCFDPNVSHYQCDSDQNHVFYADDLNGNEASDPDDMDDDAGEGEGIEVQLSSFEEIFPFVRKK